MLPIDQLQTLATRGLEIRAVLDELNADHARLKKEWDDHWKKNRELFEAMRENPSEATARAYAENYNWCANSNANFDARAAVDERRKAARSTLSNLIDQAMKLLGLALKEEDWKQ